MKIPSVANEGKKTKHIFLGVGHLIFEGGGGEWKIREQKYCKALTVVKKIMQHEWL